MVKRDKTGEYYVIYKQDEDGYFIASCPSIKGCVAAGKTMEEAYQNIQEAIESCLEALEKVKVSLGVLSWKCYLKCNLKPILMTIRRLFL